MAKDGADMEKLSNDLDRLQNAIEAANGWELDRVLQRAMDALRCPDSGALVANLSGEQTLGVTSVGKCVSMLASVSLLLVARLDSLKCLS